MDPKVYKILNDPDWINSKRFDNSLQKLLERYPDGVPQHIAALALMISEEEYVEVLQEVISKLRDLMKVDTAIQTA